MGVDLERFSDDELSIAYVGLGATSCSSFGLKIKAEIDRRNKKKTGRNASYVRALEFFIAAALMVLGVLLAIKLTQ